MFARKNEIVKMMKLVLANADCEWDYTVCRITNNALEARDAERKHEPKPYFEHITTDELAYLNGFECNFGFGSEDFYLTQGYDLHTYAFSKKAAEAIIDWLWEDQCFKYRYLAVRHEVESKAA